MRKRELAALLCLPDVLRLSILWLFLAVLWVALQCVIVVFSGPTHSLFVATILQNKL